MLFDHDSTKWRSINVADVGNKRWYTDLKQNGDGLAVDNSHMSVTFSPLLYHGECGFLHRVAEIGGLLSWQTSFP